MIKRSVFEQVGMFSDDYFMYAEDLDLCRKTVRAGYCNYYAGQASVIHYGGGSSEPRSATIMKWESILKYCEKHRGLSYALLFRFVMILVAILRLLVMAAMPISRSPGRRATPAYSSAAKWKTILSTLTKSRGQRARRLNLVP